MKEKIIFKAKVEQASEHTIDEIVKKTGIVLPSSHLAIFISPMTPIEKANQNGVRVSREAIDKFKDTLIQSQVNFDHNGAGFCCGSIIDTWVDEDSKEQKVAFTFFKGLYPEEYIQALELMSQGKLSVSFELLTDVDTKEELADNTVRLHDIEYTGMGLLMGVPPAYKDAQVEEFATLVKERVNNYKEKELICASQIIKDCDKALKTSLEASKKTDKGGNKLMDEEQKKLVTDIRAELGDKIPEDVTDEQLLNEEFVADLRKSAEEVAEKTEEKEEASEETEEAKAEEASEETEEAKEAEAETEEASDENKDVEKEEAKTEYVTEENRTVKETIDDKEDKIEVESETVSTVVQDGEQTSQEVTKQKVERTFTFAELEARVAELEEALKAKDSEIEEVRANAEKIGKLKVELKDNSYVAEFTEEDYLDEAKVDHAKLQQENDELKAKLENKEEVSEEIEAEEKSEETEDKEEVQASKTDLDTGYSGKNDEGGLRSVLKDTFNKRTKK